MQRSETMAREATNDDHPGHTHRPRRSGSAGPEGHNPPTVQVVYPDLGGQVQRAPKATTHRPYRSYTLTLEVRFSGPGGHQLPPQLATLSGPRDYPCKEPQGYNSPHYHDYVNLSNPEVATKLTVIPARSFI